MAGFTVNTTSLAIRVGELNAVAADIGSLASDLQCPAGDLGPGEINAALAEVAGDWQDGLNEMRDKISTIAGNVDGAVANYTAVEEASEQRLHQLVDQQIGQQVLDTLLQVHKQANLIGPPAPTTAPGAAGSTQGGTP
jgi:hypothetical protein